MAGSRACTIPSCGNRWLGTADFMPVNTARDFYLRQVASRRDRVPDFGKYPFNVPAIASLELRSLLAGE